MHFSSLWVLSFVILTEKAVEYSDHVLVREIKGEDKGALELFDLTLDAFIAMMQNIGGHAVYYFLINQTLRFGGVA